NRFCCRGVQRAEDLTIVKNRRAGLRKRPEDGTCHRPCIESVDLPCSRGAYATPLAALVNGAILGMGNPPAAESIWVSPLPLSPRKAGGRGSANANHDNPPRMRRRCYS